MISSGIIRRIDELGRIVIPKEIRKKLRIKTGDNLEILVENDDILLKKYSQIENIENVVDSYAKSFNNVLKYNVIITDTDKIVSVSGNLKKKYFNLNISSDIESIINRREVRNSNKRNSLEISPGFFEEGYYVTAPIIKNGDALGVVIIFSLNNPLLPGEDKLASILADLLCNYFV